MTLRNTLIALAAAATATAGMAAPALAHGHHGRWNHDNGWHQRYDNRDAFDHRIDNLRETIRHNRDTGRLSQHETWRLEDQLQQIAWQKLEFKRTNGYNQREVWILNSRIDDLTSQVRYRIAGGSRW